MTVRISEVVPRVTRSEYEVGVKMLKSRSDNSSMVEATIC
jgi:hypothetical protein